MKSSHLRLLVAISAAAFLMAALTVHPVRSIFASLSLYFVLFFLELTADRFDR
jgi:hypothetical protein